MSISIIHTRGRSIRGAALGALCAAVCLLSVPAVSEGFSVTSAGGSLTSAAGEPSRQAGAHPDFTTTLQFSAQENLRDVSVALPPGLFANPTQAMTCSGVQLTGSNASGSPGGSSLCPLESQVGTTTLYLDASLEGGVLLPLYNLEPNANEPAAFGFNYTGVIARIVPHVRPGDYGITASDLSISSGLPIKGVKITLWGVPADPSHDAERFLGDTWFRSLGHPSTAARAPFVTTPTSCGTSTVTTASADSWENPGVFSTTSFSSDFEGTPFVMDGCFRLGFTPSMTVRPVSQATDSPTGLDVEISVPQNEDPNGLATAALRRAVVTLPQGMTLSPAAAEGLGACSPSGIGLETEAPPTCPASSRIGTVTLETPLQKEPLDGEVILAEQNNNPFHSMLSMYLVVSGHGVLLKLAGKVEADPVTGQLTATFDNQPELPFSHLHIRFRGGARAPLATPEACGTYTTHAAFTSWASSTPVDVEAPLVIDQNCSPRGFSPGFTAGVANPFAGASSPFALTFFRNDGEQSLSTIDATFPPGLLANLGSVPLCPEPKAAAGTCDAASQIGQVEVLSGAGPTPVSIPMPGKPPTAVYLAGPYKGAPFSLSIVTPAQAGPFDLGTVVVRAALFVDRHDAHVTVVSDPMPTIVDGIQLRLRQVTVNVTRPGFMVNPTSCAPGQVKAEIHSTAGAVASVASRFAIGGCRELKFAPKLAVSTSAHTSRAAGASLTVKLSYPTGGQANVKSVKVELPASLPSRLTTLQKACTAVQFETNPAGCPSESVVGHAVVHTQLLPVPLEGPAYFVSHGGEAFPSLILVLQGDGVTVELVGATHIKNGVTSSTFASAPDVPFESFELTLPEGKYSALAANGSLCKPTVTKTVKKRVRVLVKGRMRTITRKVKGQVATKLQMPDQLVGQNGAEIHQITPIRVTGCAKARSAKRHPSDKANRNHGK